MTTYTIYVANFLLLVCYSVALWIISRTNPKLQGMRLLAWAYTTALMAAIIAASPSATEHWFVHAFSPTLLLLCFILLHYCFLSFVGRPPRRPWGWMATLAFGFAVYLYCGMNPQRYLMRAEINSLLLGGQAALSVYVLLRYTEKSLKYPVRGITFVFALFCLRSLGRYVWILHYHSVPELMSGWWTQIVGVSTYLILNAFTPLGYLWMATTRLQSELESLSSTDWLTSTLNRRAFEEKGQTEVERSRRYHLPMSVVAMDVDRFKLLNDSRGHAGGDKVLVAIADAMRGLLRSSDQLGRFGGDEFVVLLPATGMDGARELAERLRECIATVAVDFQGESIEVRASFGVATMTVPRMGEEDADTWEMLLQRADAALYRAKKSGRNRVA